MASRNWASASVNGDGGVVPIDVLVGINELNARTVVEADGRLPDRALHPTAPFWDTNGDGFLAPLDILLVINALNQDETPPTINVGLVADTAAFGATNADRVTADARMSRIISDNLTGITSLTVAVDDAAAQSVTFERSGAFVFDPGLPVDGSRMERIESRCKPWMELGILRRSSLLSNLTPHRQILRPLTCQRRRIRERSATNRRISAA